MIETFFKEGHIRTFSGKYISVKNPDPLSVFVVDIAVGLAREPRFGGHTKKPYSVAEHSIWCMQKAEEIYPQYPAFAFKCFLHDAHEAYLKDIPTPTKAELPGYEVLAEMHQDAIHQRYCVSLTHIEKQMIKHIDKLALEWEIENKVLAWKGLELTDQARVDLFIHHFVQLCKLPFAIQP